MKVKFNKEKILSTIKTVDFAMLFVISILAVLSGAFLTSVWEEAMAAFMDSSGEFAELTENDLNSLLLISGLVIISGIGLIIYKFKEEFAILEVVKLALGYILSFAFSTFLLIIPMGFMIIMQKLMYINYHINLTVFNMISFVIFSTTFIYALGNIGEFKKEKKVDFFKIIKKSQISLIFLLVIAIFLIALLLVERNVGQLVYVTTLSINMSAFLSVYFVFYQLIKLFNKNSKKG